MTLKFFIKAVVIVVKFLFKQYVTLITFVNNCNNNNNKSCSA